MSSLIPPDPLPKAEQEKSNKRRDERRKALRCLDIQPSPAVNPRSTVRMAIHKTWEAHASCLRVGLRGRAPKARETRWYDWMESDWQGHEAGGIWVPSLTLPHPPTLPSLVTSSYPVGLSNVI